MIWGFQKSENGKPDKFDSAGEAIAYISLDQAVLTARRLVREDEERYLHRLGWDTIVWTETDSEQREDSYRVVLQFRRPERGLREEQTGEEEFIFDLTGGLQDRQVLLWPEPTEKVRLLTPPPGGILKKCVNSQAVYPLSEQHGLKARERRYTAHEEGKHWE